MLARIKIQSFARLGRQPEVTLLYRVVHSWCGHGAAAHRGWAMHVHWGLEMSPAKVRDHSVL